jgi:type II secretory pathway pseudopilin PulG
MNHEARIFMKSDRDMKNFRLRITRHESGQTLIETLIAVFILVTAVLSAIGVVIHALGTSSVSRNQIIALNLAREGIDVIRSMRDSNWMAADLSLDTTDDLQTCGDPQLQSYLICYKQTFAGPSFNLADSGIDTRKYRIDFDPNNPYYFNLTQTTGDQNYLLCLQSNGTYMSNSLGSAPIACADSKFARRITINSNSNSPYTVQNPEKIIKSIVVWKGRGCTDFNQTVDPDALATPCKVSIEEHLTNWKDFK